MPLTRAALAKHHFSLLVIAVKRFLSTKNLQERAFSLVLSVPDLKANVFQDSDQHLVMWEGEGVIKVLHNLTGYFFPLHI